MNRKVWTRSATGKQPDCFRTRRAGPVYKFSLNGSINIMVVVTLKLRAPPLLSAVPQAVTESWDSLNGLTSNSQAAFLSLPPHVSVRAPRPLLDYWWKCWRELSEVLKFRSCSVGCLLRCADWAKSHHSTSVIYCLVFLFVVLLLFIYINITAATLYLHTYINTYLHTYIHTYMYRNTIWQLPRG